MRKITAVASSLVVALALLPRAHAQDAFRSDPAWVAKDGALTLDAVSAVNTLKTRDDLGDSITSFEFRAPVGAHASLYVQGRYAVALEGNGDWQPVAIRFRAARFDPGFRKSQNALALEIRRGDTTQRNVLFEQPDAAAVSTNESPRGVTLLQVPQGPFSVRNAVHKPADYSQVNPPATSGGETNEASLVDLVRLGHETFESVGCSACHLVQRSETAVSAGPNLWGLFRPEPRDRDVVEGEGHRFRVKAGREYLHASIRAPADQLAIGESGAVAGKPYPAAMPAFSKEVLSDAQIDALYEYLVTLNDPALRAPVTKLAVLAPAAPYDPLADALQFLVTDEVRVQRGPLPGASGRGIHVGHPNGVSYTFDPRVLAVVKIWQGGFLDMTGELTNRGGKGLALGHESREIAFGEREYLLAPLDGAGRTIDFSFKEAKFGDLATAQAGLRDPRDQLQRIADVHAQFLGYERDSRDKLAVPTFRYRVDDNTIDMTTAIAADGTISIGVGGTLKAKQSFVLNPQILAGAKVDSGTIDGDRWTLPAGRVRASLQARVSLIEKPWRPAPTDFKFKRAQLQKAPATAQLPAGYSIENYYPPKDNYGRDQLFEALGLALTRDGTIVVGTRTAGIWRIVGGEWRLFAEGLFDSLGVVAEDAKGLTVVAGQKPELTRISDTNGDGIADRFDTLFDAHSYHGNYHTYMHGPVRGPDGSYYFALNLAHDGAGTTYNVGGQYMGTWGGFSGWAIRSQGAGKFELFANGLRSPASMAFDPQGGLWYADNQGEYVGTSKLFQLRKDRFYGHPSSLVDLPGMTPQSPQIAWDQWAARKEREVILFPHNRVANAPGNPVWIPRKTFEPFVGQMLIGDQTQSNLLRVVTEEVDGVEQGSVMPFFAGLESGVMRPLFLRDGSLLLGQTGRGWQAKGGKIASLQHVRWDGKTIAPAIAAVLAIPGGLRIDLTQPLTAAASDTSLRSALALESWTYRDAPDYGSDELDLHAEGIASIELSADRKAISVKLASIEQKQVHPHQTGRVYHLALSTVNLFGANAPEQLQAYYTLHRFPKK